MVIKGRITINKMSSGVHLVKIIEIRYYRDAKGNIKMTNGNPSIQILFENKEKQRIDLIIQSGDKSQWIIDLLCNTIGIKAENGEVDAKDLIKQKIYIIVANEYLIHEGKRRLDSTGNEIVYQKVLTRFFNANGGVPIINEEEFILEKETV